MGETDSIELSINLICGPVLSCRYVRRGRPEEGLPLFQNESLKWPGFVEFDDVNGKVLTYSQQDR
jgi:hypothetical protein